MKKITIGLLLLMICLTVVQPAFADEKVNDNIKLEGVTYKKVDKIIDVDKEISNIQLNINKDSIKGHFLINNEKVKIHAEFIEKDENDFNFYIGAAKFKNVTYNVDIIEHDNGLSGLIYDDSRTDVIPFVITKSLSSNKNDIKSKDVINQVRTELMKQESETPSIEEIQPLSYGISRTKYISHSGWSFPNALSSGEVYGILYYKTDIVGGKFWVDKVVGTVAWESGFDGLSITNDNEVYGHLWAFPSCPQKR